MTGPSRRTVVAGLALAGCGIPVAEWLGTARAQAPSVIPPAVLDDALEVEGDALAARLAQTRMAVDVRVNGQGPFRFTVDSGADRTVIGARVAAALGLPAGPSVLLHSTTGSDRVATVRIEALTIGDSMISDVVAPALPERFVGAQGLLGIDALADQRLMLDFEQRQIVVQDTRRHASTNPQSGEIVVVARRHKGQLILTQVSAGRVPLYAIIDSGSEVTVGNSALRRRLFGQRDAPPVSAVDIIGVTGQSVRADGLTLSDFYVGGIHLQNVPVAFLDSPPFALFGLADRPAMLLGSDVLSVFARVSLDFHARRVRFRLRA